MALRSGGARPRGDFLTLPLVRFLRAADFFFVSVVFGAAENSLAQGTARVNHAAS
jgi:hypothetical protein